MDDNGRGETHSVKKYASRNHHRDHRKYKGNLQRMTVGYPSHHGGRRYIAKKMVDKNTGGDCGRANVRANGIHDSRIQWRGVEQQQERSNGDGGQHNWSLKK